MPVVQEAAAFARNNVSSFVDLVPEPGPLERAKNYREEKIMPLVQKLKAKFLGLYRMVLDLQGKLEKLREKLNSVTKERDRYKDLYRNEQEKREKLQKDAANLHRVKRALGPDKIDAVIAIERERDAAREAEQLALEQQRKPARKRHDREAR